MTLGAVEQGRKAREAPAPGTADATLYTCAGGPCPDAVKAAVDQINVAAGQATDEKGQAALERLVKFLGTADTDNGVIINVAETLPDDYAGMATYDSGTGDVTLSILQSTVDGAASSANDLQILTGVIGHEASHGADVLDRRSNFTSTTCSEPRRTSLNLGPTWIP